MPTEYFCCGCGTPLETVEMKDHYYSCGCPHGVVIIDREYWSSILPVLRAWIGDV